MSQTYRIVRFHQTGGPEVLRLETAPMPSPGPGEVLLKIKTLGMTQGDAMYREGTYLETPRCPSGLGTEGCGEIVAAGPNTAPWKIGERVSVHASHSKSAYPLYGEFALMPVTSIVASPKAMSDDEAGGFTLAYMPMYLALVREAKLRPGEVVVLNAAGATTSLAACQIAKKLGATVFGIVRSPAKAALLEGQGFDRVLVWGEDIVDQVKTHAPRGADVMLDPVLGPDAQRLSEMAAPRARIIHYGALQSPIAEHSIYQMAPKFLTIMGFTIYGYTGSRVMNIPRDEAAVDEAMAFIAEGAAAGDIRPLIHKIYPLDEIVAAHRALQDSGHIGKIIVRP